MTYSEAFPLWVAEVYRNHGYEPDKWYGSEVAETLYNEAMATYNGPPATMRDYIEAIPSADEFAYLDYAIERLRRDNINLNALSDKERWALMSPVSGSIWMTEQCFLSASPPASGAFSSSRKVPRRTGTRSVRKRVRTTTAMSFTPKLMLFGMKLHRRETEGR